VVDTAVLTIPLYEPGLSPGNCGYARRLREGGSVPGAPARLPFYRLTRMERMTRGLDERSGASRLRVDCDLRAEWDDPHQVAEPGLVGVQAARADGARGRAAVDREAVATRPAAREVRLVA